MGVVRVGLRLDCRSRGEAFLLNGWGMGRGFALLSVSGILIEKSVQVLSFLWHSPFFPDGLNDQ